MTAISHHQQHNLISLLILLHTTYFLANDWLSAGSIQILQWLGKKHMTSTFKCRASMITGDCCLDVFVNLSQLLIFISKIHSNWNFNCQQISFQLLPLLTRKTHSPQFFFPIKYQIYMYTKFHALVSREYSVHVYTLLPKTIHFPSKMFHET